jgi:nitrite reductase (NADH) large subunit
MTMMLKRLLIIGNGMASVRLVEHILRLDAEQFAITIVGAEPQAGYNRVLLSALLARDVNEADITLKEPCWYADNGINLITGDAVLSIDADKKTALLQSGHSLSFDLCVFATGSHPIRLPIPGMDKKNVMAFRDVVDVEKMSEAAIAHQRVAVIGGGLLGIEAAYGLAKRGADVTLVHVMDRLMERQLDETAASLVRKALERRGVKVLLQKQTSAVLGEEHVKGLAFADGSMIAAELLVCAIGIRPNCEAAISAGVLINRGIAVDDRMQTSKPGYYAIGECAEHRGIAYGLVEPAYAQADILAQTLVQQVSTEAGFEGMVLATNLKVSGLPVFSAGQFIGGEGLQCIRLHDKANRSYRKLVLDENKLVGCIMVGNADDALWYRDLIRSGIDVSSAREKLIHGRHFAEPFLTPSEALQAA